jgi:hypothetical protein
VTNILSLTSLSPHKHLIKTSEEVKLLDFRGLQLKTYTILRLMKARDRDPEFQSHNIHGVIVSDAVAESDSLLVANA